MLAFAALLSTVRGALPSGPAFGTLDPPSCRPANVRIGADALVFCPRKGDRMQKRDLDVGQMIEHARFGRGEILKAVGDFRDIWFLQLGEAKRIRRDHLALSPDQARVPRRKTAAAPSAGSPPRKPPAGALDWNLALEAFGRAFPLAFGDDAWKAGGGGPAREAAGRARAATAPGGPLERAVAAGDGARAAATLRDMLPRDAKGRVALLSPFEGMALQAALDDGPAALRLAAAVGELLAGGDGGDGALGRYLDAVASLPATARGDPAKWPVATLFPFLASPERHMFLKPVATRRVADALQVSFEYQPSLNVATYRSLLVFARRLSEFLAGRFAPHPPTDHIDLQAFVAWCQESRPCPASTP